MQASTGRCRLMQASAGCCRHPQAYPILQAYADLCRQMPAFDISAGRCGETEELESREPVINTPPHLSRHQNGILEKKRFWLAESRERVRRCDTTRPCGSTKSRNTQVISKFGKDRFCISLYDNKMRWRLSTPGSLKYILPVAQSTSVIPVSPYTRHRSVLCQAEWRWW